MTFGEILPGGVVLELVESSSGRGVELLRWKAETCEVAPQFKEGEIIYTPGYLHPSLRVATRLATRAGRIRGFPEALLEDRRSLPRPHRALAREHGVFMTRCVFSTWLPDLLRKSHYRCVLQA